MLARVASSRPAWTASPLAGTELGALSSYSFPMLSESVHNHYPEAAFWVGIRTEGGEVASSFFPSCSFGLKRESEVMLIALKTVC